MSESDSPDPKFDHIDKRTPGTDSPSKEDREGARPQRLLFDELKIGLRAFLRTRLRQESDVDDCLQVVFVKLVESGNTVAPAALRAWIFRVAANEAARMWRSEASKKRMLQKHGADDEADASDPIENIILRESAHQLQLKLQQLPPTWQEVVRLRIHDNLTFQEIADQLGIPLGTALTQMRRSLERLKSEMDHDSQ